MARVRYSFGSRHTGKLENIKKQRTTFPAIMKEVITISDVILEVMDARYFIEMRNEEIEHYLRKEKKRIIYVLNKADLVNTEKLEQTIPKDMKPYVIVSVKTGEGAKDLRERIQIEAKKSLKNNTFARAHIGVIGYPNAGKSSLINLITRRGVTGTSAKAGYTKGMQKIRFTKNIMILDTPGVIPEKYYSTENKKRRATDTKLNSRSFSDVKDPEDIVQQLLEQYKKQIEKHYDIKTKGNAEILLEELGRKKGFLQKGNTIDTDRTARLILKEIQEGTIQLQD